MFASQFCLWVHVTVVLMWQRGGYYRRVAQFCVVVLAPACLLISVAVIFGLVRWMRDLP